MKVLHVVSGRLFGGIERVLVTMARCRQCAPLLDVEFAVAAPGRLLEALGESGAAVHALGDVRLRRPASVVDARHRLRAAIAASRPEIVILHAPWAYALFAPAARRAGTRVVLWQHDAATGRPIVERWTRLTPADLVICNSEWTRRSAHRLQPAAATETIYCPVRVPNVPEGTRAALRRVLGVGPDHVVLLSASRMEAWKGHMGLLNAASALNAVPGWTLWIAGGAQRSGERRYQAALEREAAARGLGSRVRFLGPRDDVPALLSACDVLCQANERPEPFGIVFAEALLSGVPVVTVGAGGAPEIVNERCGRLVAPGDAAAFAGAVRELILDPDLRRELGGRGPEHAAAICAPEVVLQQLYRRLASTQKAAA